MRTKIGLLLLVGFCVLSAGCRTTLEGSYWMPDFSSKQTGDGGDELDLGNQLGVEIDEQVLIYELIGDAGRNRIRLDYWVLHGEGTSDEHNGFDFNGDTYLVNHNIETIMDLESIGVLWEPAIIKTDGFRLRIAMGLDLLRFTIAIQDLDPPLFLSGEVEFPGPDDPIGIGYMPVPKLGLSFEADLKPWVRLHARAQMFDASYLEIDDSLSGTFTNAVGGLMFGKHRGLRIFVGYRYFNAEYQYNADSGDSTLEGFVASTSLRF
jgi:hypothetical protein